MALFMFCSVAWSVLILTDSLQMWHAAALLLVHGCAGVFWGPPGQVLIHDIVEGPQLSSAVRLMATSRYLGLLAGPAVGGAFLLIFGPPHGLMLNALLYLPLILWLWKAPYGPRFPLGRRNAAQPHRASSTSWPPSGANLRPALHRLHDPAFGLRSLMVANAYQAQMPEFGRDLGHGDAGPPTAASRRRCGRRAHRRRGLESQGLNPNPRTAFVLAMLWCCAIAVFAMSASYPLALALLFMAGFLELSFNSMAQALVQIHAPAAIRRPVIGLYSMAGWACAPAAASPSAFSATSSASTGRCR
jgi:MFS family permease